MSEDTEDFGTPERPEKPRRDGQGSRGNRFESSSDERPNRYGVPRDGKPRHQRDSRPPRSDRPQRGDRPSYGNRPQRGERPPYGDRPQRSERPRYGDRQDRPRSSNRDSSRSDRPYRPSSDRPTYGDRGDRNARLDRGGYARGGSSGSPRGKRPGTERNGARERHERPRYEERELTEQELLARRLRRVRPDHSDPDIDVDVTEDMLDKGARNELKTLMKENAEVVAKHLVMATRLLDSDPELAHQHVISASRKAGRIAIVRETLGITAYATGDFALALRELRTFRRISGSDEQIALMVDSERGVGRPDRALELGRSVDRSTLSEGTQVALAIAMSGARLDQDQVELALAELEIPQLDPTKAFSYSPALFFAYAEVLEEMGRHQEAAEWTSCAEIAAQALADAQGSVEDGTEEDMIVVEESVDEHDQELLADSDDFSAVLEDEVRQVLEETAHLDAEDKA